MHLRPRFRFTALLWSLSVLALTTAGIAWETQGASPRRSLRLRLVSISQGNRESAFGDDPARFRATPLFRAAQLAAADINPPSHPLFVHSVKNGRLFYLFYNDVDNVVGKQYLVQRIRKTVRNYSGAEDTNPETRTTFLVEVSKVRHGGTIKPDQHFGVYHLGSFFRRDIVKQIEVGTGSIPGTAVGDSWPFERRRLFKMIQDYSPKPDAYERVEYETSRTWTISVSFDRRGGYSIRVPELGIDAPRAVPQLERGSGPGVEGASEEGTAGRSERPRRRREAGRAGKTSRSQAGAWERELEGSEPETDRQAAQHQGQARGRQGVAV